MSVKLIPYQVAVLNEARIPLLQGGENVNVVRVYLTEGKGKGKGKVKKLLNWLQNDQGVRGATVFRGIAGFGPSGVVHETSWTDLSLDLPLIIEFFDEPDKITRIIAQFDSQVQVGHILYWPAKVS